MKSLLLPLLTALVLPTAVNANVEPKIHNLCKDVKDYIGCVKANTKKEGWKPFKKTANKKNLKNLFNLLKHKKKNGVNTLNGLIIFQKKFLHVLIT